MSRIDTAAFEATQLGSEDGKAGSPRKGAVHVVTKACGWANIDTESLTAADRQYVRNAYNTAYDKSRPGGPPANP